MATNDIRLATQASSGNWQDAPLVSLPNSDLAFGSNGVMAVRKGATLRPTVASSVDATGDIQISVPSSLYFLRTAYVAQTGATSLALLVSELRTAAAGAGTLLGTFALNASLNAANAITVVSSLLQTALRTETTLYWRITTAVASGTAVLYLSVLDSTP